MANKLKENSEIKQHYAFRKIGKQLLSISVGLVFAGVLNERQTNQVKAAIPDNNEVSQVKSNQAVVTFGKIIPVNSDRTRIPNAPTPHYRRDPDDPNKAIATPVPKIKDYKLAKDDQTSNLDVETQMVMPPANVEEDTEIIYIKDRVEPEPSQKPDQTEPETKPDEVKPNESVNNRPGTNRPTSKPTSPPAPAPSPSRPNRPNVNQGFVQNQQPSFNQVSTNQVNTNSQVSNNQAVNQTIFASVQNYQAQANDQNSSSAISNQEAANITSSDSNAASVVVSEQETDTKSSKVKKEKSKAKKENKNKKRKKRKVTSEKKESPKSKKKRQKKKAPSLITGMPKVVMNPETEVPPRPVKAIVTFFDNKKQLLQLTSQGSEGEPIIFKDFSETFANMQKKGYQLEDAVDKTNDKKIHLQDRFAFGFYDNQDVEFVINLAHRLEAVTSENIPENVPIYKLKKMTSLVVRYHGAGDRTPKENIQTAVWRRSLTLDCVTSELVPHGKFDTAWQSSPLAYDAVISPKIAGYIADPKEVVKMAVAEHDIIKNVTYEPIEVHSQPKQKKVQKLAVKPVLTSKVVKDILMKEKQEREAKQEKVKEPSKLPKKKEKQATKPTPKPAPKPAKKQEVKVKKKSTPQAKKPEIKPSSSNLEHRVFIDEAGKQLHEDQNIAPESPFLVIPGYYLTQTGRQGDEVVGHYAKMGQVIPVDEFGNLIVDPDNPAKAVTGKSFENDSNDPHLAKANQKVPKIVGWQASRTTITPDNPAINIPVIYHRVASSQEKED